MTVQPLCRLITADWAWLGALPLWNATVEGPAWYGNVTAVLGWPCRALPSDHWGITAIPTQPKNGLAAAEPCRRNPTLVDGRLNGKDVAFPAWSGRSAP